MQSIDAYVLHRIQWVCVYSSDTIIYPYVVIYLERQAHPQNREPYDIVINAHTLDYNIIMRNIGRDLSIGYR
jgi:hypothetical protein